MLSNPVTFFINGYTTASFAYEGGDKLWHFSPNQCGLSNSMEMNLIFFANDVQHALDVVERMVKFAIECYETKYKPSQEDLVEWRKKDKSRFHKLLENKDKWIVTLAPMNQMFKAGWAANDTI